jgi:HAD superfamily hydrolase (TIGR01549 family)
MLRIMLAMPMQPTKKKPDSLGELRCFIFDLDGTLVENMELIVRSVNFTVKDLVGKEFSRGELYPRFGATLEQIVSNLVPAAERDMAVQRYHAYYREYFRDLAHVYEGIPTLISRLRGEGIGMAIYTGSDARMTNTTLELTDLQEQFPVVVTADDVKEGKPDPEGLIRALDLMHASRKGALYLGDAVRDVEAAKRAGIWPAAALWGFGDPAALKNSGPNFAFEKPLDVIQLLA